MYSRSVHASRNAPQRVTGTRKPDGLRWRGASRGDGTARHVLDASVDDGSGSLEKEPTDSSILDGVTKRDTPQSFDAKIKASVEGTFVSKDQSNGDSASINLIAIGDEASVASMESTTNWTPDFFPNSMQDLQTKWSALPSRYRVILGTTAAFVLCNMDKVNISVAIIPMAKEMGWSVGQAGLLQSAFFYGFALSQLPGGYLATRFGGARMLPLGVFLWSAATCAVPFCASDPNLLFLSRVLVGLGEGVSPAAATDVIARSVPVAERSRAVAFVFNGFNIGSVLGLSLAPAIIENFGWRSVFLVFGGLGVFWVGWVGLGVYKRGGAMPSVVNIPGVSSSKTVPSECLPIQGLTGQRAKEIGGEVDGNSKEVQGNSNEVSNSESNTESDNPPVPWREIINSTPVRALAYVHFCNNWGFYVLLAWLPSYFTQELGVTLTNASLFTLLPPLANIAVASIVGPLADDALKKGIPVTTVRKVAQIVALCGPATFMALASIFGDDDSGLVTVFLLTIGLSLSSFSYAGLYCNHQDMSPRYASILLGMTNTIGALPGVIGVPLTGLLLQKTENWELSMFLPAIILYFSGAAVFAKWGDGEKQSWG